MAHGEEIQQGERFAFGENWSLFLKLLNENRIRMAEDSLKRMLEVHTLEGKTFLDIGSGSGLFSLAARRLGAKVHSFDFDPQSVSCTRQLRERFFCNDANWIIEEGSALDENYLNRLGQFDVVYSWGVLHHTGDMWRALANAAQKVSQVGKLFIAIYNDQGLRSRRWLLVKQAFNRLPTGLRWIVWMPCLVRLWGPTLIRDLLRGRPFYSWTHYAERDARGMSPWRDVVDWVGGLPFEVAKPEQIFDFYRQRGFKLECVKTCGGGLGCNEFVFSREAS